MRKLEGVIHKVGRFLDPIIAVRLAERGEGPVRYWTPDGLYRLSAMRTLGARSITAIVVPEKAAASFKPDRVKMEDLARSGGAPQGETE